MRKIGKSVPTEFIRLDGTLGSDALQEFTVIIDFPNSQLEVRQ